MNQDLLRDTEQHMDKSLEILRRELTNIRTGRANPGIISRWYDRPIHQARKPVKVARRTWAVPEPRPRVTASPLVR